MLVHLERAALPVLLAGALLLASCGKPPQAPECAAFVACVRARDALQGSSTDVVRFEASGACWNNDSLADGCQKACVRGRAWLGTLAGAPAECAP